MQYRQPMHRSLSMRTTPSSVAKVAPTGQTWTHGGFAQLLQSLGTKKLRMTSRSSGATSGGFLLGALTLSTSTSPFLLMSYRSIQVRKKNDSRGTSFSPFHPSTHPLQPMHLSTSMPMP